MSDTPVSLQLVGDISLNGPFTDPARHAALRSNLAELAGRLGACDLRIANFESPLWGDGGVNLLKRPRICTTIEAARCLEPLRLDVALLGNNHVYDCLEAGSDNTTRFLDSIGVRWLGAARTRAEAERPLQITVRERRVGILNYVGDETHPNLPAGAQVFLNRFEVERALAEVTDISRTSDLTLVFLHWGADEFISHPTAEQRRVARRLIEVGADVVACGHAHCLQGWEAWGGRGAILYGLGNFLFHEFGDRVGREFPWYCREGAVFQCLVSAAEGVQVQAIPLVQEGLSVQLDDRVERVHRLRRLCQDLAADDSVLDRKCRHDRLRERYVRLPLRSVREAGGLLPAARRVRLSSLRSWLAGR